MRLPPLVAALLVQAALWFWNLGLLPIWGDEQFTLTTVALPWGEIAGALERDIHPPLYYFALKLWLAVWPADVEPIVAARAFSATCALAATVALDRLWLRNLQPTARLIFLALWTLSPCLLLYGRMARSYSLQLLLAALALEAAARWLDNKKPAAALRFAGVEALLLYTHYLPGLAVGAAAGLLGLRRAPRQALAAGGLVALLYLPWIAVLGSSLGKAAVREAYSLSGNSVVETALRLAFAGVSFTVGEAVNTPLVAAAVVLAPAALGLTAWAGWKQSDVRWKLAALAGVIAYFGAAQWVSYPFVPARLLFLLPFLLGGIGLAAAGGGRLAVAVAAALGVSALAGQTLYRRQEGFLNKGYLIPYGEIADRITRETPPSQALVLVDAFNGDPKPLHAALPPGYRVLDATSAAFPAEVALLIREDEPAAVWYVRSTRDVSPSAVHARTEQTLSEAYEEVRTCFLPYSAVERRMLGALSGAAPPDCHFQLSKWTLKTPSGAEARGASQRIGAVINE